MKKLLNDPEIKAYCLYVYHRFKKLDDIGHYKRKYRKRTPKEVQEMEKVRGRLHEDALNFLINNGVSETDATKLLEGECERLIKEEIEPLKKGEVYCGLCRIKVKIKDFDKHSKTDIVHNKIAEDVMAIHKLGMFVKLELMKNGKTNLKKKKEA